MDDAIKQAIQELATKSKDATQPHEAMNFAQAALNLAHTLHVINNVYNT